MIVLALALMFAPAQSEADQPRSYLLSLSPRLLHSGDSMESFELQTWGVTFKSICHIPDGWTLTAGESSDSAGTLSGEGSNGVTWIVPGNRAALKNLALITLYTPVQESDQDEGGGAVSPATFKGHADIYSLKQGRRASLTSSSVELIPAKRCP